MSEREIHGLLSEVAKIVRKDNYSSEKFISYHLVIRGSTTSWLITSAGELTQFNSSKQKLPVDPDMVLTYQSPEVFLKLVKGELKGHTAVLTGKLSFTGDLKNLRLLAEWFGKAQNAIAQCAQNSISSAASSFKAPILVQRSSWQSDDLAPVCSVCEAQFKMYRRKHHCRVCGLVCCASCSMRKVKGARCCDACHYNITMQRASTNRDDVSSTDIGLDDSEQPEALIEKSEIVQLLKERILSLERDVKENDRKSYAFKASLLLIAVDICHSTIVISCLALVMFIFHFLALGFQSQIGPVLLVFSFRNPLSFVYWLKNVKPLEIKDSLCTSTHDLFFLESDEQHELTLLDCPLECESSILPPIPMHAEFRTLSINTYEFALLILILILLSHQILTRFSLQRRLRTFLVAATVTFSLMITRRRVKLMSEMESDEAWLSIHKLLAPFMYRSILRLKGLWVKFGQFASSRSDVMPQPFIEELGKLQDSVPASPYAIVKRTIENELKKSVESLFGSISEKALASASVAQVHKGKLKDGTSIVVKVQHEEVQRLMMADLEDIMTIAKFIGWVDNQYDFRPICIEWTREVRKELDFVNEADNLVCLRQAMLDSNLDVRIPELIPEFTTSRVIVMKFCEGFKVTDTVEMENASLDRLAIMESVCKSFAYQVHILGRFNGDPHPGNILIETYTDEIGNAKARPVLLDWGLAKKLPEYLRLAFSKFVVAAKEMDFVLMLESVDDMKMKLNRFDPLEDMTNIRFLMRDTSPPDQARAETQKFKKLMVKRIEAGKRNPINAYPGELLFFLRVTQLLHGLGSRLHVRAKYMDFMAPEAIRALRNVVPKTHWAASIIYPTPLLSPLEAKIRGYLEKMVAEGEVRGCQVCVFEHGNMIVNTFAGEQGQLDPRPVSNSTLFCAFSVGKIVASCCIHKLVDQRKITYDTKLATFWPEFAKNGKENMTIRHILTHTSGLQHILPDKPTLDDICDWSKMLHVLEQSTPLWPPGTRSAYHYFTFGWLVGACVEKISGQKFSDFLRTEIAIPLGVANEMFIGSLEALGVGKDRIAGMEMELQMETFGGDGDMMAAEEAECEGRAGRGKEGEFSPPKGFLHMMAEAIKSEDPVEGAALEQLAEKLTRREYLLDPRLFNSRQVQEACIPSANGLFTAHALAKLHNNFLISLGSVRTRMAPDSVPILSRECVDMFRKYSASDSSATHRLFGMQNRIRFGLGCQLFGFKEDNQRIRLSGFGHVGMGGSVALCDPATGVSFAMTVNKIRPGRKPTVDVFSIVCTELNMGSPRSFIVSTLAFLHVIDTGNTFLFQSKFTFTFGRQHARHFMTAADADGFETLNKMKVSEIKAELDLRGIGYKNVFEKTELVGLLKEARVRGKADPSIVNRFNRDMLEMKFDDELKDLMKDVDKDMLKDMAAADGSLPGGMSPDMMQKMMANPELMVMLQNPKMQDIMKSVMKDGPAAMAKYMGDPEAMQILQKLSSIIST